MPDLFDDPSIEEWRPAPGMRLSEVSSLGRVRCASPQRRGVKGAHAGTLNRPKGRFDCLEGDGLGGCVNRPVHRLVCEAFHGPPPFPGAMACHLDGDARNNRADNLRWQTQSQNMLDKHRHGTFWQAKLSPDAVRAIRAAPKAPGMRLALAARFGVSVESIAHVRRFPRTVWIGIEPESD